MINNVMFGVLSYRIDNYNYHCNNCDNFSSSNCYYW